MTWIVQGNINSCYQTSPFDSGVESPNWNNLHQQLKHFCLRKFLLTLCPPCSWIKFSIIKGSILSQRNTGDFPWAVFLTSSGFQKKPSFLVFKSNPFPIPGWFNGLLPGDCLKDNWVIHGAVTQKNENFFFISKRPGYLLIILIYVSVYLEFLLRSNVKLS